jgi:hypothetical protein
MLELLAAAALLAKSHLLGKLRAGRGVIGRYHRVVRSQAPFLAILLGRHIVLRPQMTLERLELLSVLKTNDVIGSYRLLDRNRGLRRISRILPSRGRHPRKRRVHLIDERRYFGGRHRIITYISRDNIRRQPDESVICRSFSHGCEVPNLC